MQFLILSDPHANWPALEAVIADARGKYDKAVCCGDLVGYNPNPQPVIDWVREHCATVIRGNHDKVIAGIDDLDWFNEVAQAAARWTIDSLPPEHLTYLRSLPEGPVSTEHFQMWHGSPGEEDEYVTSVREAARQFGLFEMPLAFFGHTHLQGGFFSKHGKVGALPQVARNATSRTIELHPDSVYMVNPGSVGQPRDRDPRAAYALYDSEAKTITLCRVEYPVEKVAADIQAAGLPSVLGMRLFHGL